MSTITTPSARAGEVSQPVPWLSAEQQRSWRAYLDGSTLLTEALSRALEADAGLSLPEYEVMVRLSEAPGRTLRMAALADSLAHSRSRLTHTVARMEKNGLVTRQTCSADGRGVNCVLTDSGFARLEAAAPGHVAAVRAHLVDVLGDARLQALGIAMAAVRDALAPARAAAALVDRADRTDESHEAPLGVCET
jgi:DNA-binding MarR family transcriptional regulator